MRIVALLLIAMLAGCLSDDKNQSDEPDELGTGPITFNGNGTILPSTANGTTHYHYTGFDGAEPNIGITSSGNIFVTAFDDTIRSEDGGITWESVYNYDLIQGQVARGTNDPMLWVDTDTDRIFTNHMLGTQCFTMIWSDDEGDSWFQRDAACTIPIVDHQKVMTSKAGPQLNPQALLLGVPGNYPNAVHTCHNAALGTQCFTSFDGGLTYTQESIAMGTALGQGPGGPCEGVAGHPAQAPDGTIALAAGWLCGPAVSHSRDTGRTWTVHVGPQMFGVGSSIDPDLTFTEDGNMYLFYRDGSHMARVARSADYGANWDGVWNITHPGLTSTRFHVMSSGDDGRIAMAYLGTTLPVGTNWTDANGVEQVWTGRPHDAPPQTHWHLYITLSENADSAEPIFTSYQVTPDDDPVQVGCAWESGGGGGPRSCRNMLDFIDSAVSPEGQFYVTYTEGCTIRNACAGNATDINEMESRDREIAVATLEDWLLRSD